MSTITPPPSAKEDSIAMCPYGCGKTLVSCTCGKRAVDSR